MKKSFITTAAAILLAIAANLGSAAAQAHTKVGVLDCDISGGIGLIIASKKEVTCSYSSATDPRQVYVGSISKFGLDIGETSRGRMVWTVYSATRGGGPVSLAGRYAGASAEATIGAGLGANVLVGGSNQTIALQPVSVQGQAGLNLAVGVAELTLRQAQ